MRTPIVMLMTLAQWQYGALCSVEEGPVAQRAGLRRAVRLKASAVCRARVRVVRISILTSSRGSSRPIWLFGTHSSKRVGPFECRGHHGHFSPAASLPTTASYTEDMPSAQRLVPFKPVLFQGIT